MKKDKFTWRIHHVFMKKRDVSPLSKEHLQKCCKHYNHKYLHLVKTLCFYQNYNHFQHLYFNKFQWWAIWYHFYNLKNVKNTHEGVLFLVKKTLFHGCLSRFLNCRNVTKSRKESHILCPVAYLEYCQNYPVGIYMFKVNNRNTRTKSEICSKLTIKTPERRQ